MFKILTDRDARLLLEMCIDAEERCDLRIQEARDNGDSQAVMAAIQKKEKYENLKRKIVAEIQGDQSSIMEDSTVFSERVRKLQDKQE